MLQIRTATIGSIKRIELLSNQDASDDNGV